MGTKFKLFAVLAFALLVGCARESKVPATPTGFPFAAGDPVAQAEAARQARLSALTDGGAKARSSEDTALDVQALTACIANAVKSDKDPATCNCIKEALESHADPAAVCSQRGMSKPAPAKAKSEESDDEDEESGVAAPIAPLAPMLVGVIGSTPPPGWSHATGFKFDFSSFPRTLDDRGNENPECEIEMAIDGRLVMWQRNGRPILVPVPQGAGMPMPGGAGNLTSVLPRGESGYVLLSHAMQGGQIVPVPTTYGRHEASVRCWRYDVGLTNVSGPITRSVTATLVKESAKGMRFLNTASGREEVHNYSFRPSTSAAPTTPLWQG